MNRLFTLYEKIQQVQNTSIGYSYSNICVYTSQNLLSIVLMSEKPDALTYNVICSGGANLANQLPFIIILPTNTFLPT